MINLARPKPTPVSRHRYARLIYGVCPVLIVPFFLSPFFFFAQLPHTPLTDSSPSLSGATATSISTEIPFIEKVTTAKDVDSVGCALNETSSFTTADSNIYFTFVVEDYADGAVFSTRWQGPGFDKKINFRLSGNGSRICVWVTIVPQYFNLQPGAYTVTLNAPANLVRSANFTLERSLCRPLRSGITGNSSLQATPSIGDSWLEKDLDPEGKTQMQTTVFSTSDACIYAVFEVKDTPAGIPFMVHWQGDGLDIQHNALAQSIGFDVQVRDFITPKTLSLKPGAYTVTLTGPGSISKTLDFTLTPAQESSATPTSTSTASYAGGDLIKIEPVATATP